MRIKEVLKEKGMTQVELANRLNVGVVSIKKTIAGNPTIKTLEKIAEVLNVPVWHLFINPADANGKTKDDNFIAFVWNNGRTFTFEGVDAFKKFASELPSRHESDAEC